MVLNGSISGVTSAVSGHLDRIMQALERSPAVSYILDFQFRILYCNPAWNRFATANGGRQLTSEAVIGFNLFDTIPEVLRVFYSDAFQHVLSTGKVWEKSYECSSPTVFRLFRMRIHLLKPQKWFIVTNTLVVERAHATIAPADLNAYADDNGILVVCAHCRCSRKQSSLDQWDFVPGHLEKTPCFPAKVSHGLCPVCRAYFYPDAFF
jgi:PAS fold